MTAPRALATETRWWPSRTAYASPTPTTEIGGSRVPRCSASQTRSQRSRAVAPGRNSRSNCAARFYGGGDGGERDRAHAGRAGAPGPCRPRVVNSEARRRRTDGRARGTGKRRGGARARRCRTLVARRLSPRSSSRGSAAERAAGVVAGALRAERHVSGDPVAVAVEEANGERGADLRAGAGGGPAAQRGDRVVLHRRGAGVEGRAVAHRADRVREAVDRHAGLDRAVGAAGERVGGPEDHAHEVPVRRGVAVEVQIRAGDGGRGVPTGKRGRRDGGRRERGGRDGGGEEGGGGRGHRAAFRGAGLCDQGRRRGRLPPGGQRVSRPGGRPTRVVRSAARRGARGPAREPIAS